MLIFTETGHCFTAVADFDDPAVLWVRSQDRQSIEDYADWLGAWQPERPDVVNEPSWDYQFRVKSTREDWAGYLEHQAMGIVAHKLKPAVAQARGALHPVARAVEEVFYFLSHNRPDGSKPAWLGGAPRRAKRPAGRRPAKKAAAGR